MSRRTNSQELRGYKDAVVDLRHDNDRLNQQLAHITQQLVRTQGHKNTLMQENEMLKSIITEMQAGLAVERDHIMRDAASVVRRGSMHSRHFGSRRMTGGCDTCGCGSKTGGCKTCGCRNKTGGCKTCGCGKKKTRKGKEKK